MKRVEKVLLPGMSKQAEILIDNIHLNIDKILILGAGTIIPAISLRDHYNADVIEIVEDEDSLLTDRLQIKGEKNISVRLMDFTNTDFAKDQFDLVYSQGAISGKRRNKIVKEIKRVLKENGILCAGEVISLAPDPPPFLQDVWSTSDIVPLKESDLLYFYTEHNLFKLLLHFDLNDTLAEYYSTSSNLLPETEQELKPNEKSYYKKLLNRISHESNVYLKLGGDKYMGYRMFILKKDNE